ncbi:IclR family transcriptional regulator [Rhodococcus sp. D2-41]|uniref:IclR family transcriptional regulator n=1 Tax=Speluncibacter jeojiensis TaxID=2710754 RepID=UPI00240ED9DB|nr:IclR family transcriptional regulator [Rhodococcus sp. D2-41]MDG3010182.1 IclR family transcriptional regulator [Rhodococcus sp. D2-41]
MAGAHVGTRRDLPSSMLERVTLILDAFEQPSTLLNFEEVTSRTGLPRSTVHRILDQLAQLHWLDHGREGYRLGRRALRHCTDGIHGEIRRAAAPHMHELHVRTGMVVDLAVLDGSKEVIIDRLGRQSAGTPVSTVGARYPAYLTAGGRALLAWLEPERADALIQDERHGKASGSNWTPPVLRQELHWIRHRRGLSIDPTGTKGAGTSFTCVALAIRGPHGPVAAITLHPQSRPGARRASVEHIAQLLAETVRRTAIDLFPPRWHCSDKWPRHPHEHARTNLRI